MAATSAGHLNDMADDADDPAGRRLLTVLLRRYGIPVADSVTADSAESAVEAAWWLGFPVTLVADGTRLSGQARITRCGLATPAQVRAAYWQLTASVGPAMTGVRIRRQPQQGVEVVVRLVRDAGRDAKLTLGLAGPAAALVGASVTRAAPLRRGDAWEMLRELHGPPAPGRGEGAAGPPGEDGHAPDLDVAALAGLLERVGRLAEAVPQITELELNPVIVTRSGAAVAGVRGRYRRLRSVKPGRQELRSVS